MSKSFPFPDNDSNVVYARLSLHYFTDKITRQIFSNIFRVLIPDGYFCFICKSIEDPLSGQGTQIESDMYERDGHVRHFFSKEYTKSLLQNHFRTEKIEIGDEKFYGRESAFIKVIARSL